MNYNILIAKNVNNIYKCAWCDSDAKHTYSLLAKYFSYPVFVDEVLEEMFIGNMLTLKESGLYARYLKDIGVTKTLSNDIIVECPYQIGINNIIVDLLDDYPIWINSFDELFGNPGIQYVFIFNKDQQWEIWKTTKDSKRYRLKNEELL